MYGGGMAVYFVWWRHEMETFSGPLWGEPPVTGGFPSQKPVTRIFYAFFDLKRNGWSNNRGAGGLRRHRAHYDVTVMKLTAPLEDESW